MKRRILIVLLSCLFLQAGFAQNSDTTAQKEKTTINSSPKRSKSVKHKIVKGDTWYSIAKKYNISYADLRLANKDSSDILKIGKVLAIPATPDSKYDSQRNEKNMLLEKQTADVTNKMYTVKSGETLSSIARKYSVTVGQIVGWNKLPTKSLKAGQTIIVGRAEKKDVVKIASVAADTIAVKKPATTLKLNVHKTDSFVQSTAMKDSIPGKLQGTSDELVKTDETFAQGRKEISEEGAVAWIEDQEINPGKYFALHRTAPIGTIVKVTNRMNRRTVFVKVVGKLPDTGDNENLVLKISKAAADKLGVLDTRFQAQLNYGVAIQ